jgi:hypothetical protein
MAVCWSIWPQQGTFPQQHHPRVSIPENCQLHKDYLYQLAAAVRELSPDSYDSHLFALEVSSPIIRSSLGRQINVNMIDESSRAGRVEREQLRMGSKHV